MYEAFCDKNLLLACLSLLRGDPVTAERALLKVLCLVCLLTRFRIDKMSQFHLLTELSFTAQSVHVYPHDGSQWGAVARFLIGNQASMQTMAQTSSSDMYACLLVSTLL